MDLFTGTKALTSTQSPHQEIYRSLRTIRETFHREGRISDSNAKLDETVKFLLIHYGHLKGLLATADYNRLSTRQTFSVRSLNDVLLKLSEHPSFHRKGMGSILGDSPHTVFRDEDEAIAFELLLVARDTFGAQAAGIDNLDILNEAFGHHVRDNFRSHIEDAQYMTPPEVVNFMVAMALELTKDTESTDGEFIFADPSCGVGSFLTRWRAKYERSGQIGHSRPLRCIGQDKVERMVRLSAVNLLLSEEDRDDVFLGNTIDDGSPLGAYNQRVDLILTNPPFGARFPVESLRETSRQSTPFFATTLPEKRTVDSELLFLDRYITLLKEGGVCLSIVPDSVVSARGLAAVTRHHLARHAEILNVIELPPVTFAQAGTRTKTAILGFRKRRKPRPLYPTFFSEAVDIGFQVSKRKGVPVKRGCGKSQLPGILDGFKTKGWSSEVRERGQAAGVWKEISPLEMPSWTPRTVLFNQEALKRYSRHPLIPLREYVEAPEKRKGTSYHEGTYYISVLHIIGEGMLDVSGIRSYRPITPGLPVNPGEVIISRINPRIPRVAVVPELGKPLLCSSEYEILRTKDGISPYGVALLLLTPFVQEQIRSLTAGTSASHSRIQPHKVYDVLVPNIMNGTDGALGEAVAKYEEYCKLVTNSLIGIVDIKESLPV